MARRIWTILVQVMACCLMAPSHYLNQYSLIINESMRSYGSHLRVILWEIFSTWITKMCLKLTNLELQLYPSCATELKFMQLKSYFFHKYTFIYLRIHPTGELSVQRTCIASMTLTELDFNSLVPSDAIWRHRTWSILIHVMAWCLMAPSHYLNQCWLLISEVLWYSPQGNFKTTAISLTGHELTNFLNQETHHDMIRLNLLNITYGYYRGNMMMSGYENAFRITEPLWGVSTSNAEL